MPGYDPDRGLSTTHAGATVSASETPFRDLSDFVALPRVAALRLAPDGSWLAAAVQTLSPDKKKYLTSIWRIDAEGAPARRLTRSAEGEGSPRFLPDGSLLFTSRRPDPGRKKDPDGGADGGAALWLLPAGGGEARVVAALPGGVTAAETARDAAAVVVGGPVLPAASAGTGTGAGSGRGTRYGRGTRPGGGRGTAEGALRRRDHRDPARVRAHPVLGSRPGARPAPAVRRRPFPRERGDRWCRRRPRRRSGRTSRIFVRAPRPDAGAGAGAGRRGLRAVAGRRVGADRLVAVAPGRRVALRAGRHRYRQRQAAGAAVAARVRLRATRGSRPTGGSSPACASGTPPPSGR